MSARPTEYERRWREHHALPVSSKRQPSRREFLVESLMASGGFVLAVTAGVPRVAAAEPAASGAAVAEAGLAPNAFLHIGTDGTVTVFAKHDEMGQGIHTGIAIVICEELEIDVERVRVEHAPADPAHAHTQFGVQMTGGSTSTHSSFDQLRAAGATARTMLVAAAAARWGVSAGDCEAVNGTVRKRDGSESLAYGDLAAEAAGMTVPENVELKGAEAFAKIGKRVGRVDSAAKVRGTAEFGFDSRVPGMLTAMVARCPYFGGKLRGYDASEARNVPGVRAVVDVPSGVAVIADSYWAAFKGRDALRIDWEAGPGRSLDSKRLQADYRETASGEGLEAESIGDASGVLAAAEHRIDAMYEVPFEAHAPMEPLNCLVTLRDDGGADVVTGSQFLGVDHPTVAARLGVDPSKVSFRNTYLGGAFGRRANPASDYVIEAVEVALAARSLKAPIKTVWSREDDLRGGWYRPMWTNAMSASFDDGKITAWRHHVVGQSIASGTAFEAFMVHDGVDETSIEGAWHLPYAIPNQRVELSTMSLPVPVQWWRSVGHSNTAFAKEGFLDECADALGRDPYELRRELLKDQPRLLRVLDHVANAAKWSEKPGKGIGRGIAVHESFEGFAAHIVEASVENGKPKIHRIVCAIDCGPVVNPDQVEAQMQGAAIYALSAVLDGHITFTDGLVDQSNFHDFAVVRMHEAPAIEVHIVDSKDKMGGVGEVGVPGIASAVCSALAAAGGRRVRRLPIGDQLA